MRVGMAILIGLATSNSANAETLCFSLDEDWEDGDTDRTDWWKANDERRLRGIRVEVIRNNTGGQVVFDGYAAWSGSNRGCVSPNLLAGVFYTVSVYSEAYVNGRYIVVEDASDIPIRHTLTTAHKGGFLGLTEYLLDWQHYFPEMDVAGWMLFRNNLGLPAGATMRFDGAETSFLGASYEEIYIRQSLSSRIKFAHAHEIGHHIGAVADEMKNPTFDMTAARNGCNGNPGEDANNDSHQFFHREWSSSASIEGWANFVAAWAFNSGQHSDCVLAYPRSHSTEFDIFTFIPGDPDNDIYFTDGQFSCEGRPWDINHNGVRDGGEAATASWVSGRDWLEDAVQNYPGCTGTLSAVSTEYDWARYFWDMYTDESVSFGTLLSVYDSMDPRDFDPNDSDTDGSNEPEARLVWAATVNGVGAEHHRQKNNGVDH